MNVIKIYLEESGGTRLEKDIPIYRGSYQNKLLNIFVPTSILAPNFVESDVFTTAVKIGSTSVTRSGKQVVSQSYYIRYLKTLKVGNIEYALYERMLPKEFTANSGETTLVINVVTMENVGDETKVYSLTTTMESTLVVEPSTELDNEDTIEATELERINGELNALQEAKQDKVDSTINATLKDSVITSNEVSMAINDLNANAMINTSQVAKNTSDISVLQQNVQDIVNASSLGEYYVGTMTGDTLPSESELDAFVMQEESRTQKVGDTIIFIQTIENATDKSFKYFYNGNLQWQYFEIPPVELSSNGTAGLIAGTYNIGDDNTILIDIVGGKIKEIYTLIGSDYIKLSVSMDYTYSNIQKILNGQVAVNKAINDASGRSIVETYMTKLDGATKQYVVDNCITKSFAQTYFFAPNGTMQDTTYNGSEIYQPTLLNATENNVMLLTETLAFTSAFDLVQNNSYKIKTYFETDKDLDGLILKATLQIKHAEDLTYTTLDNELSNSLTFKANEMQSIEFSDVLSGLSDKWEVVSGDSLQVIITATELGNANNTTITPYGDTTYKSSFVFLISADNEEVIQVVQETGDSETAVMSQKAVSDELDTKQDTLTFDTTPTAASSNPVTSGGVYNWNKVAVKDTRNDNPTPNEVSEQSVSFDFKDGSIVGLDSWQTLMTIKGFTNGYQAEQIALYSGNSDNQNANIRPRIRYGNNTTWTNWKEFDIVDSYSIPSKDDTAHPLGYIRYNNGLQIVFGYGGGYTENVTPGNVMTQDVTFPVAFSDKPLFGVSQHWGNPTGYGGVCESNLTLDWTTKCVLNRIPKNVFITSCYILVIGKWR